MNESIIYVKHPDATCNINQAEFLKSLNPDMKIYHGRLFNQANATFQYYNQDIILNQEDFEEWLEGLNEPMKSDFRESGFESCKNQLSLRRYVLEKNDLGLDEFVNRLLKPEDIAYFVEQRKKYKNEQ
jgi:hypothetical protein